MTNDEREAHIRALLWRHAHPTLRKMDRDEISKLTEDILQIATSSGLWSKWTPDRETIATRVADLWVPMEDLREALNALPGPKLTKVDVEQRIRDIREMPYSSGYPKAELEAESYAVFAAEKERGTEFIAILGYLEDWHLGSQERLRQKAEKERRERIAQERQIAETRLRNGADCPWTPATDVIDLHSRKNGRLYRLRSLQNVGKQQPAFEVLRVDSIDSKRGRLVGRYRTRGDATKAVESVAWQENDL
jgi:hypothetical protein